MENLEDSKETELIRETALVIFLVLICLGCSGTKPKKNDAPAAPSFLPEKDLRPIIVAFGDSLTAGQGVDPKLELSCQTSGENGCSRVSLQSRQRRCGR